nr:LysR substrate-binding domain-containing protein [Paracoccus sp. PARArs4]
MTKIRPPFAPRNGANCPKDHPLMSRQLLSWGELADHRFITVGRGSGNRLIMDLGLAQSRLRPQPFFEVQHLSTSLGLVEAGLGVAALPRMSMPVGPHPRIATVRLTDPVIRRTVGIVRIAGRSRSPAAELFHEMLLSRWRMAE